ncbi:MAG TPA: aminoglycoside phosphotransferase family protein [Anaerolineales bacterium]|nr:aminoglycoside phosphotransferase family protein [Anaerolineales bacterium]
MTKTSQLIWQDPDWRRHVNDWIQAETGHRSIRITGEIEQPHMYAWSTVLHIPTDQGRLFFKATAPETIYEAALTQALANWFPDCMPELVAVEAGRGWMLMRDGGEQLRLSIRPTKDVVPWQPVILRYAEVQVALAGHITELLSLRLPDHRLSVLPRLFSELLADQESLMIDQEKGLTTPEWDEVKGKVGRFEEICRDLAALGIPESINHGDFHDGNVLVRDDGRITFFDWGDADVTHPFVSLRTFFVSLEIALELEDYLFTPEMDALLNLYLKPWEGFASKKDLLTAYRLSKPVASVVKALAWHTTISRMADELRQEYAWIVPELIREFLRHEKGLVAE